MTAPVISFINMKGGVGKTTLCVGIAEFCNNHMGRKGSELIDIDPQFSATQWRSLMGHYDRVEEYIFALRPNNQTIRKDFELPNSLMEDEKSDMEQVITKSFRTNLDIILGDINIIFDAANQEGIRIKMFA